MTNEAIKTTKPAGSHSPTPWSVDADEAPCFLRIRDDEGAPVASIHDPLAEEIPTQGERIAADAALIVSAVNSHAELVEALAQMLDAVAPFDDLTAASGLMTEEALLHRAKTRARALLSKES